MRPASREAQLLRGATAAAEALHPGGYLVVSVPNLASWGFRTFREDWWGLQLPHHLLAFDHVVGPRPQVGKLRGVRLVERLGRKRLALPGRQRLVARNRRKPGRDGRAPLEVPAGSGCRRIRRSPRATR